MSEFDREKIETAVRAWDLEPTEATIKAAFDALDAPRGFWTVDEKDDDAEISIYALSGWLAHVRALDAAKPAPAVEADPLEGEVMSTQSEREAAARAWWKDPSHGTAQALAEATRAVYGYACPQEGTLGTMLGALSLWMKWCREDAAKADPAQPAAMTLEQANPGAAMHTYTCGMTGRTWQEAGRLTKHSRCPFCACRGCMTNRALTLDEIRKAARARGYRVVHESGYEAPGAVLAYIEHALSLSDADGDRYLECFDEIEDGDKPAERAAMAVERDRLRALGVTPAVLS